MNLNRSTPGHCHKLLTLLTSRTFGVFLGAGRREHQLCVWASAAVGSVCSRDRWGIKSEGEVSLMLEDSS